MDNILVKIL
jgi:hypothetical protein